MVLKLIHLIHKTETKRLNNQLKAVYSGPEFRLGTLAHIEAVLKSYHDLKTLPMIGNERINF